jgi:hypothetical protein
MATCTITSLGGTAPSLVKLRIPFHSDKQNENCLSRVILVIDRSGSMCGGKIELFDLYDELIERQSSSMETSSISSESYS